MRILLVNHGNADSWGGGDGVQIRETAKRLHKRGHDVQIINSDQPSVREFDLVHIFNCRVHTSFVLQMQTCKAAGVPVVVSPIWVSIGRALWGSRGTMGVLQELTENTEDDTHLKLLQRRKLIVQLPDGNIDANGAGTLDLSWMEKVGELLNQADGLIPNSWLELKAVQTDLHWCGDCFEVAHYGVDPKIFLDADPMAFRQQTGIQGPFVIQGGRIEPAKNQAMLCWALRNRDIPLVLIGSSKNWPGYADLCKKILGDRLIMIDHIPQNILASAFAAASVHVLPSWMETCGLVTLEAALTGTPVVGSSFGHELEYLQGDAWFADPTNPDSLANAVQEAWEAGRYSSRPLRLQRRILENFNWEATVEQTEKLYRRVITSRR
jgi:glycosyltransferase involved in cell wall biosynthesis